MGVINTLREKMGRFVVFAVGFSILAFVATDLLGPNSAILGSGVQNVGEISGEKISYPEFNQEYETLKTNYAIMNNQSPTAEIQNSLREQAWNNLVVDYAYQKEFNAIGLKVTDEEKIDMVQGVNIHPSVVQSFTVEGQFDKSRVINFLQNFDQLDPQMQYNWRQFESNLGPERLQNKMLSLLRKSSFANKYELEAAHVKANAKLNGRILYVPYFSIADSTVNVTDDLLNQVLEERKEEFKLEDNFSIDYVTFEVKPSVDDSLYFVEEMTEVATDFREVLDDTSYIKLNSDQAEMPRLYRPDELPAVVADQIVDMDSGDVLGPVANNNNLEVYKYMGAVEDSAGEYVRASHILFKTDNGEEEAKSKAQDILARAKSGEDFAELAREHSEGPTSTKGGDLGWFGKGRMVAEFEEACFNAESEGVIPRLVKSQFGYHIINVTNAPSNKKLLLGKIIREITPSDETRNKVFRNADEFAGTVNSPEEFTNRAAELGLNVQSGRNISKNDRNINALTNIRPVIRWGFDESEVGDVSDVMESDDVFLVALLTERNEEGYADVEDVRERLMPIALKKVKAKDIINRLKELGQNDIDELKESYGQNASIYDINNLVLNTNTLRGAGFDPKAVGFAFGQNENTITDPFEGENGIIIFDVSNLVPADKPDNYDSYRNTITQQLFSKAPLDLQNTIEEKAEIVDNRYRFF